MGLGLIGVYRILKLGSIIRGLKSFAHFSGNIENLISIGGMFILLLDYDSSYFFYFLVDSLVTLIDSSSEELLS
jgi:hypothetical protein